MNVYCNWVLRWVQATSARRLCRCARGRARRGGRAARCWRRWRWRRRWPRTAVCAAAPTTSGCSTSCSGTGQYYILTTLFINVNLYLGDYSRMDRWMFSRSFEMIHNLGHNVNVYQIFAKTMNTWRRSSVGRLLALIYRLALCVLAYFVRL